MLPCGELSAASLPLQLPAPWTFRIVTALVMFGSFLLTGVRALTQSIESRMLRKIVLLACLVAGADAILPPALQSVQRRVTAGLSARCTAAAEQMGALNLNSLPGSRVATAGVFGTMAGMMLPQEAQAMPRKGASGGRAGGGFFGKKKEEQQQPATAMNAAPAAQAGGTHTVVEHHHHHGGGYGYGGGVSTGTFLAMSAIELGAAMHREQQRQAYLQQQMQMAQQLGKDQAQIEMLSKQLAETNAKMAEIEAAKKQNA
mmetsp:Transcript_22086/g.34618  ORF Transcript_22086/g.34618 Transcript_22086/m.34618 type:complete len:258 (+) Transcript_22086:219-992(+)